MKNVIICDLDGTLANCEHRVHHVQKTDGNGLKRKPNWDAFYAGVKDDTVNEAVWKVLRRFFAEFNYNEGEWIYDVRFMSGRPERCRADTVAWLNREEVVGDFFTNADALSAKLYMRPDGDFRADYIVKEEMFRASGIDPEKVLFVMDDRQQVVDMWRRIGLTCFQVAPGNF